MPLRRVIGDLLACHVQPLSVILHGSYGILYVGCKISSGFFWDLLPPEVLALPGFHFLLCYCDTNEQRADMFPFNFFGPVGEP